MQKRFLLTPGPSPVPPSVREIMAREIIHHRTEEFRSILNQVHTGLQEVFKTENPVVVFSSSGTGAMEAAVANFFCPNDTVITISGGKFGERWTEISRAYGLNVLEHKIRWGSAPAAEDIKRLLAHNKEVKAVFATLCETSTATVYDIQAIAQVVRKSDAILIVDAISGLGQDKLLTDEWGVDVVVSGSQKGFMLSPGLAYLSVSKKAQQLVEKSTLPKYYFDLEKALKNHEKDDTPFTPSVSLLCGLQESLRLILNEGVEQRWKFFAHLAHAAREALDALGLKIFSQHPSSSVTAVVVPQDIASSQIVKKLKNELGVTIAGGQGSLKDKIIRIAHMGWITQHDLLVGLAILEKGLKELGYKFDTGASLQKFQEVFYG